MDVEAALVICSNTRYEDVEYEGETYEIGFFDFEFRLTATGPILWKCTYASELDLENAPFDLRYHIRYDDDFPTFDAAKDKFLAESKYKITRGFR